MTAIILKHISKNYSTNVPVLKDINLSIESGELIVFIGSSGCGKSTLLRIISGLDTPSGGEIWFDQDLMNQVAPGQRQVGMVFQSYALYPHMTVKENLSFGLKQKKLGKQEIEASVQQVAQTLEIEALLNLKPEALSGGQQQRVAIGRCIVQTPRLFLFDEPLSNLDTELRVKTRREIRRLHQTLKATMIYVTHDQVEAMTLADKIAVFAPLSEHNQINLQQFGTPLTLYNQPANKFVAGFLGTPKINFIAATVIQCNDVSFDIELANGMRMTFEINKNVNTEAIFLGQKVDLAIRPEHFRLLAGQGDMNLIVEYDSCEQLGAETLMYFTFGQDAIAAKFAQQTSISQTAESKTNLYFNLANCFVFDHESGNRLV